MTCSSVSLFNQMAASTTVTRWLGYLKDSTAAVYGQRVSSSLRLRGRHIYKTGSKHAKRINSRHRFTSNMWLVKKEKRKLNERFRDSLTFSRWEERPSRKLAGSIRESKCMLMGRNCLNDCNGIDWRRLLLFGRLRIVQVLWLLVKHEVLA